MEEDAADQCDQAEDPVLHRTEVRAAGTTTEGSGTDAEQREADGGYDRSGNDRRDQPDPVLREETEDTLDDTTYEHRAHDGTVAILCTDEAEDRHEGEADTHDDREAGAQLPEEREELDQCTDPGDQHCTLDEHRGLRARESAGTTHDQDRGDVCDEHREDVLEAERDGVHHRHLALQRINITDRSAFCLVTHVSPCTMRYCSRN